MSQFDLSDFKRVTLSKAFNAFDTLLLLLLLLESESDSNAPDDSKFDGDEWRIFQEITRSGLWSFLWR